MCTTCQIVDGVDPTPDDIDDMRWMAQDAIDRALTTARAEKALDEFYVWAFQGIDIFTGEVHSRDLATAAYRDECAYGAGPDISF